jgi:hypothetical protein
MSQGSRRSSIESVLSSGISLISLTTFWIWRVDLRRNCVDLGTEAFFMVPLVQSVLDPVKKGSAPVNKAPEEMATRLGSGTFSLQVPLPNVTHEKRLLFAISMLSLLLVLRVMVMLDTETTA